jgi:hypothetical protein
MKQQLLLRFNDSRFVPLTASVLVIGATTFVF